MRKAPHIFFQQKMAFYLCTIPLKVLLFVKTSFVQYCKIKNILKNYVKSFCTARAPQVFFHKTVAIFWHIVHLKMLCFDKINLKVFLQE